MPTANLGLPQFQGSSVVDYKDFNDAFNTIDKLGTDYVIEQGISGTHWYYRKWNSGRMECWIDSKGEGFEKLRLYVWNNSEFVNSQRCNFGPYPFNGFRSRPFCTVTFNWCRVPNEALGFVAHKASSGGSDSPTFCIVTANENLTYMEGAVFGLYASGFYR